MKVRVISALILAIVCIPALILGGLFTDILVAAVVLIGCYEFCSIREKRFNVLLYISMVIFIFFLNVFTDSQVGLTIFFIIYLFFIAILFEDISLDDIAAVFLMSMILGIAVFSVLRMYDRDNGAMMMIYVLLASFGCDIAALFVGMLFGKHKLNERVSPKKTVEGAIGGWIFGALLSFIFALFFFPKAHMLYFFVNSLTLPIVSQIGDLSFSLIKRNYGVKDFGSIIPGHGGILDRVDSLLFCLIYCVSMWEMFL